MKENENYGSVRSKEGGRKAEGERGGEGNILLHKVSNILVLCISASSTLFKAVPSMSVIVLRRPSGVGMVADKESDFDTTLRGTVAITCLYWLKFSITKWYDKPKEE